MLRHTYSTCPSLCSAVNTHRYCKVTAKRMSGERKRKMVFRWAGPVGLSVLLAAVIDCKLEDDNFASSQSSWNRRFMCSTKLPNDRELLIKMSLCFVGWQHCVLLWSTVCGEGETLNCICCKEISSRKVRFCVIWYQLIYLIIQHNGLKHKTYGGKGKKRRSTILEG